MEKEMSYRKKNRLENYDYSTIGAYFVTVCTKQRKNHFWQSVGVTIGRPQDVRLSEYGKVVDSAIKNIPMVYPAVSVDSYVIMPDHIHMLLIISGDEQGRPMVAPTVSRIVQQMKGYVTKRIGESIWQKLFYDHVIRNTKDYEEHLKYIYDNPEKTQFNKLYIE